jgi:hypothetical protein
MDRGQNITGLINSRWFVYYERSLHSRLGPGLDACTHLRAIGHEYLVQ